MVSSASKDIMGLMAKIFQHKELPHAVTDVLKRVIDSLC